MQCLRIIRFITINRELLISLKKLLFNEFYIDFNYSSILIILLNFSIKKDGLQSAFFNNVAISLSSSLNIEHKNSARYIMFNKIKKIKFSINAK